MGADGAGWGGADGAGGGAKEVAFASNVGGWVGGFITSVIGLSAVLSNSGEGSANPSLRAPRHTPILRPHGEGPVRARRGWPKKLTEELANHLR